MEEETRRQVWMCKWCGPHPDSSARWCAAGCGSDYNEMIDATIGAQRWGDYFRSLPVEERMAAMGMERSGWSGHRRGAWNAVVSVHDKNSAHMDGCIPLYIESLPAGREKK